MIRNISVQWRISSVLLVGLQCYVHMLIFAWVRWRCYAPGVWTSHSNTDLAAVSFFTTEYSYLVFPSVTGRKLVSGTHNSLMVSQITVNEMYLTKHECLMYKCPLLSLSRPSTGPMKRTPLGHFLGCGLTCHNIDVSDQMNLPILHWLWKRSWGHKLRGIYLHLVRWMPCLEFDFGLEKY